MRIGSIIISHLSKRWKAKFFTLCDVISLVKLQGKFEVDHSAVPSEQNRSSFGSAPFVRIHWILSCQGLESSQSPAASPDVDTWTTGCGIQETYQLWAVPLWTGKTLLQNLSSHGNHCMTLLSNIRRAPCRLVPLITWGYVADLWYLAFNF